MEEIKYFNLVANDDTKIKIDSKSAKKSALLIDIIQDFTNEEEVDLNISRETLVFIVEYLTYYRDVIVENIKRSRTKVNVGRLIAMVEQNELSISANGVMFNTDRESVLSTILKKWFDERVIYKNKMKTAYKAGNKELGAAMHMKQYTMKILLNSLYGATALGSFRYGNVILSESITLSGQRIIQESALAANREMNKEMKA